MKHPNPARITAALNAANEKLKTSNGLSVCIPPVYLHTLMDCGAYSQYWRKRCNALLTFIGVDVKECEGCGLLAEGWEHAYGADGIDVCPDCRMVEGFKYLEQEAE